MPDIFLVGQVARVFGEIRNDSGVLTDPESILIKTRLGSGQVVSFAFGIAPEIVRDSVGKFHADLPLTAKGTLYYRWEVGTPNVGAVEGEIVVSGGRFQ